MILHHQFIRNAKKYSNKFAFIDKTMGKRISFSKALIAALLFSRRYIKFKDKYVGVMIPNSAGSFLSVLGLLMAGKVPVLINYSTGAEQNCLYARERCGFHTILTSKALLEKVKCPKLSGMIYIEDLSQKFRLVEKIKAVCLSIMPVPILLKLLPTAHVDDTCTILFTSGSESDPKAVQLSHRNIGSNVKDILKVFNLKQDDLVLSILPLFHVFGLTTGYWMPLTLGVPIVSCANPLEFKKIPTYIREEKVTLIPATPSFFAAYLRESKPGDFASVRIMVPGGDKTPEWLKEGYREKHQRELYEGYGTTETSPVIATNTPEAHKPGSVGRVLPNARVRIVHVDTGETLPAGQEGKILVKGDLVMKGYFDDIEATSLRIQNGWYETGDMGVLDADGFLWHRGRLRRFVKIGGEMISMVKTESVLETFLPSGVDCCVVEIPDRKKGARLVAVTTEQIEKSKIVKKMGKLLPNLAIPKTFLVIPDLPKMGSGKVDFRTVTKMVRKEVSH